MLFDAALHAVLLGALGALAFVLVGCTKHSLGRPVAGDSAWHWATAGAWLGAAASLLLIGIAPPDWLALPAAGALALLMAPCPSRWRRDDGWDQARLATRLAAIIVAALALATVLLLALAIVLLVVAVLVAGAAAPYVLAVRVPLAGHLLGGLAIGLWLVVAALLHRAGPSAATSHPLVRRWSAWRWSPPLTLLATLGTALTLWRFEVVLPWAWLAFAGQAVALLALAVRRRRADVGGREFLLAGATGLAAGAVLAWAMTVGWGMALSLVAGALAAMLSTRVRAAVRRSDPTQLSERLLLAILLVIVCAQLVLVLDHTILNVALPTMAKDLEASASELQWIVAVYPLSMASLMLPFGNVADRIGRRRVMTWGLTVFGVATFAAAQATDPAVVIAARAVMGAAAAAISPTLLSTLKAAYGPKRDKVVGRRWAIINGVGLVSGPIVGGLLIRLSGGGWAIVFYATLPLVGLALLGALSVIRRGDRSGGVPVDWRGMLLSCAGLAGLIWGLIEAPDRGWTDPAILGALSVAAVVLAVFGWWELRTAHPMADLRLFRNGRFAGGVGTLVVVQFTMTGVLFLLAPYLQLVHGYGPLETGLRSSPLAVLVPAALVAGRMLAKGWSERAVVIVGFGALTGAMLLLSTGDADTGYGLVLAALVLGGTGLGFATTVAGGLVVKGAPKDRPTGAMAVFNSSTQVSQSLGVAILASIANWVYLLSIDAGAAGLPQPAVDAAREGIGGAFAHGASAVPVEVVRLAQVSYVDGLNTALRTAAVVPAAVALILFAGVVRQALQRRRARRA